MIREITHDMRSLLIDSRRLRSFGFLVGSILTAIALFWLWRADWVITAWATVVGAAGVLLVLTGLVIPRALRLPYVGWMLLAYVLGYIMTRVILTIVFVLVVTPIGLVLRMMGKDPMPKRADAELPSYWIPKEYDPADRKRYEKLY